MLRNLLIIEPHFSGHRASYVCWIAEDAIKYDYNNVHIVTFYKNSNHQNLIELQKKLGDKLTISLVCDSYSKSFEPYLINLIKQEIYYWKLLRLFYEVALNKSGFEVVVVPYLDYCLNAISLFGAPFGRTYWTGIVMRQAFHFNEIGVIGPQSRFLQIKKILFNKILNNNTLKCLFSIDETLVEYIKSRNGNSLNKLRYLVDPAEMNGCITKTASREQLGIAQHSKVILVFGTIDSRKGLDTLFTALENNNYVSEITILIAGVQSESVFELIKSNQNQKKIHRLNIIQINKILTKDETFSVFKSTDIVWLVYNNHFSMSGVLVQAALMGLPVISCNYGLLGWVTKNRKCGVVVDNKNIKDVCDGINKLLTEFEFNHACGVNGIREFGHHTVSNFTNSIFLNLQSPLSSHLEK